MQRRAGLLVSDWNFLKVVHETISSERGGGRPVQAGEAEPVPAGGEQQAPGSSDDTSWKVVRQARHEILREYLRVSLQLGDSVQVQTEGLLGEGRLGLERDHLTVTTRSPH